MNVLLIITLVAALALGGTGVTAYAAQDSLPTGTLYAVKLATEDMRLNLASDPQAQLNLLLEMAQTRTTEMTALAARGEPSPESVPVRLRTHLDAALQVAAQLGEPEMAAALEKIRASVETQTQAMLQARQNAPGDSGLQLAQQTLTQTRERVELGLSDPALFRNRVNQNRPEAAPTQPDLMPGAGNGNGAGPQPSRTSAPSDTPQPGSGNGNGPGYQASGTPPPAYTPQGTSSGQGNGYGPGPEATCTCTPEYDGNSYGPGSGDNSSATPQGNSYGPGPDVTGTCAPEYDGNSYGPGPGNPSATPDGDNNSQPGNPGNGPKP